MKKGKELVSIIIPLYNNEKYIEECISSITQQSYKNLEIIVIDDGSTDNSYFIANKINDTRIKLFRQENKGVNQARYLGLKKARGKYCMFVDSDDFIDRKCVEKLMTYINKGQYESIRFIGMTYPSMRIKNFYNFKGKLEIIPTCGEIQELLLFNKFLNSLCFGIYKKELLIGNKAFLSNYCTAEDYWANLEFYSKNPKTLFINNVLYYYRDNPDSTTKTIDMLKSMRSATEAIIIYGKVYDYLDRWDNKTIDKNEVSIKILEYLRSYITKIFYGKLHYKDCKYFLLDCFNSHTFIRINENMNKKECKKLVFSKGIIYYLKNYYLFKCILNKKPLNFYIYSKFMFLFR